ncbi:uncharacterized protein LOC121410136 [Lytechinus variegatus]|uniref:uncharacterized protein LOC121410136 n=1 Tax=Lytechinus variegatus TaxID=7654 RepID=UPI001BB12A88|nr:uncharacterized protein LOC121410136 [Lytechinus variegatus]
MLLYVESSAFVVHTFVLQCSARDTLARIRAKLLHILYVMGREDHQFRLRFKGQYLRDAYTLDDYLIGDRCILKMVPMAKRQESFVDMRSKGRHDLGAGQTEEIKTSLIHEVAMLKWRETMLGDFRASIYINWLFVLFAFFTTYWYSGLWTGVIALYGLLQCPSFSHKAGFVGPSSLWPRFFLAIFNVLTMLNWGASVALAILSLLSVLNFNCTPIDEDDDSCSIQYVNLIYSLVYYGLHVIYMFGIWSAGWSLFYNFRFEIGDYLENELIISRDVEKVIEIAKNGRLKEQRQAAFELATLATAGDDSKFRIVAEGGLEVLITLGLSSDEAIQEYATEALAELLVVPAIQDQFVESGGIRTLTTLLHSRNTRLVQEAITALSYIVSDSEDNKHAVISDRGLEDLAHAAKTGSDTTRRYVAGIFLDLAFSSEIRSQMASMITPTGALVSLCTSQDNETLRLALQTLELVAIESSDVILEQEDLLPNLLNITSNSLDSGIYLLAGKILLYFAENTESCDNLLSQESLTNTLTQFVETKDPTLQKVVTKIIMSATEERNLALKAKDLQLDEILVLMRESSTDREAWNMADQGIAIFQDPSYPDNVINRTEEATTSSEHSSSTMDLSKVPALNWASPDERKAAMASPTPGYGEGDMAKAGAMGGVDDMTASTGSLRARYKDKMGSLSSFKK